MAGGDSPRQKMINLMYLVFIAMLALNMSKEVLNAFGLMNVNIENSNEAVDSKNDAQMDQLSVLASDQPEKYKPLMAKAEKVSSVSDEYYSYLEELKNELEGTVEDPTDYQVMDKGDYLDQKFFKVDSYSEEGEQFVSEMNEYRSKMLSVVGENPQAAEQLNENFTPNEEEDRDGKIVDYLNYHYQGFPLIASIAKLTLLQSQIKTTEADVLNTLLAGELKSQVSMTNYTTLMETPKPAYYNGEIFNGNIVLGRKDATLIPKRVDLTLDGRKLTEKDYDIEEGRVILKVNAGSVGDHKIAGNLIYEQDGEDLPVPVTQSFATIAKPNSATIAADKMNVVYRGVPNPMTISFAGIQPNKVSASAPGLTKGSGTSYTMRPQTGSEVRINVRGELPNGDPVTDNATFRIKGLPKPTGAISGISENVKKSRSNLGISTVSAEFDDFDFDLSPRVTGFTFKVPGQPAVVVSGNRLNAAAKSALQRARKGDLVQIASIRAVVPGLQLQQPSSVTVELTD